MPYMDLLAPARKPAHSEPALVGTFGSRDDAKRIAHHYERCNVEPLTPEQFRIAATMRERSAVSMS